MHRWLPFSIKIFGTLYLIEAPLLLVLRAIVLMFVPSKSDWTDEFRGFQYRTWSVVLLLAFAAFFSSGVLCWVSGVRLGRNRPNAEHNWRYLAAGLVAVHLLWLVWVFLTADRFLLVHLVQALLVFALALYSWIVLPQATAKTALPPRRP